jgi:hypothetical protein
MFKKRLYKWKFPVSISLWIEQKGGEEISQQEEEQLQNKIESIVSTSLMREGFDLDDDGCEVSIDLPRQMYEIEPEWEAI